MASNVETEQLLQHLPEESLSFIKVYLLLQNPMVYDSETIRSISAQKRCGVFASVVFFANFAKKRKTNQNNNHEEEFYQCQTGLSHRLP